MTVVCAWCLKFLGTKEPYEDTSITHGICEVCVKKMLKDEACVKKVLKEAGVMASKKNPKKGRRKSHLKTWVVSLLERSSFTSVFIGFVILLGVNNVYSESVSKIVGVYGEGAATPFPTSIRILCDGNTTTNTNCPTYFSPDFTDTNGKTFYGLSNFVSPPRCVKSVDGGTTWTTCVSNPFSSLFNTTYTPSFTMNRNGDLIAAGDIDDSSQSCVIRKSNDKGVTWSTVFSISSTTGYCGDVLFNTIQCARNSDICSLLGNAPGVRRGLDVLWFVSIDGGNTWSVGTSFFTTAGSGELTRGIAVNSDGTLGIGGGQINSLVARHLAYTFSGTSWSQTVWPLIGFPGVATGNFRCYPIFDDIQSNPELVCTPEQGASSTTYYFVNVTSGGSVTVNKSFTMLGGVPSVTVYNILPVQYDANTYYLSHAVTVSGSPFVRVWITRDRFSSVFSLGDMSPTMIDTTCCKGNMYKYNGKIYFSSGRTFGSSGQNQLFVVE